MGILEIGEWAWQRQVEQSCVEGRVACARAGPRLLKFWRCETKLFSDTHPTAVHNQPRTASKSLIPTPRDDPSVPGRTRQVAKSTVQGTDTDHLSSSLHFLLLLDYASPSIR
jgi:hypothetical protein